MPYLIYQYTFYEVDWVKYAVLCGTTHVVAMMLIYKGFNPGTLLVLHGYV